MSFRLLDRIAPMGLVILALIFVAGGCVTPTPIEDALAAQPRPLADQERDAQRRPGRVLSFFGVEAGNTALDLYASSGYYTEVLSTAVGPTGRVLAQNDAYTREAREGALIRELDARVESGRIPNVERLDRELDDLGLEAGSVDFALTALNFHDVHNTLGEEAVMNFLAEVHRVLKPDGVFGIVDHVGHPGVDNAKLHRIPERTVVRAVREAGFIVDGRSSVLHREWDDGSESVFAKSVSGKTNRFVLRLRKAS